MRKAQVTLFAVIAAILLLGAAVFFYTTESERVIVDPFSTTFIDVPTEFKPVTDYIDACLHDVAKAGLKRIGDHGGYITLENNPYVSTPELGESTEAGAFAIFPQSNLYVPYWYHLDSNNDCTGQCTFTSEQPPLDGPNSVESQLASYIGDEIEGCLKEFEAFTAQGFDLIVRAPPQAFVQIGEDDVSIVLDYPIDMRRGGAAFDLERSLVVLEVDLFSLYELGNWITALEGEYRFLERQMLDLIVAFSGKDSTKLPPMSDVSLDFGSSQSWTKSGVQQHVQQILSSYVQLFQVENSGNFDRALFDTSIQQHLYDQTIVPNNLSLPHIDASFSYLNWPIYFDLNCEGEHCGPISANSLIEFFGFQEYKFAYDVSYPVMVELTDTEAFDGEGFTLRFGLESNIRNNKFMPPTFIPLRGLESDVSTLLCQKSTWTSDEVTVRVRDTIGTPVDADILYRVAGETCHVGKTSNGILTSRFPEGVIGGGLRVVTSDSIEKIVEFDPGIDGNEVEVEVVPVYDMQVELMKKILQPSASGLQLSGNALALSDKEQAVIRLKRVGDESSDPFVAVSQITGPTTSSIRIAPGTYEADIILLRDERLYIPPKEVCSRSNLFTGKQCYTIPELTLGEDGSPYPLGGFKGEIEIESQDLAGNDVLTLHAIQTAVPTTVDEFSASQNVDQHSATYLTALQPEYR